MRSLRQKNINKRKTKGYDIYSDYQDFVSRSFEEKKLSLVRNLIKMIKNNYQQIVDEKDKPEDELAMIEIRKNIDTVLPMLKRNLIFYKTSTI